MTSAKHLDTLRLMSIRHFYTATNSYTCVRTIGNGGSGTVFEVRDEDDERFALKLLKHSAGQKRKRFRNELAFCRTQQHLNIVKILDEGIAIEKTEQMPFFVMPLYDATLRKLIDSGTPVTNALELFAKILDGVEAAHLQNVIHRDLKPENILCDASGRQVAVGDFGIAHFSEEALFTVVKTGPAERLANFLYAAPEQRKPGASVDHRADIFALGLMLNELFTGAVLQGTSFRTIGDAAPAFSFLDPIVERMVRQDPSGRYSSIREVKHELQLSGVEHANLQKLDKLRQAVVPDATPDDPLRVLDVEVIKPEFHSGALYFELSPPPPENWIQQLHGLRVFHSAPGGFGPARVEFHADLRSGAGPAVRRRASLPAKPESIIQTLEMVKAWLASANTHYRKHLRREAERLREQHKEELERQRRILEDNARANELLRKANLI